MKQTLQGKLLGDMKQDKALAMRWGSFSPGIWDDDDCPASTKHIAVMKDGRIIDLGEARLDIKHTASPQDFETYEVVAI